MTLILPEHALVFHTTLESIQAMTLGAEGQALLAQGLPRGYVLSLYKLSARDTQAELLAWLRRPRDAAAATKFLKQAEVLWKRNKVQESLVRRLCFEYNAPGMKESSVWDVVSEHGKIFGHERMYEHLSITVRLFAQLVTTGEYMIDADDMALVVRAYNFWQDLLKFVRAEDQVQSSL